MTSHQASNAADWGPDSCAWEAWSRTVIQNRLAQHARGIDRADEALLREAYHDDGTVDYGSLQGSAAEFAAAIAAMHDGAPMSSHRTSNLWIAIEGQSAISESYVMAWVTLPTDGDPQPHLVGGRYLDRHRYKHDDWRMQHRQYVLDWITQFPAPQPTVARPAFAPQSFSPQGAHFPWDAGSALMAAHASSKQSTKESAPMNETQALEEVSGRTAGDYPELGLSLRTRRGSGRPRYHPLCVSRRCRDGDRCLSMVRLWSLRLRLASCSMKARNVLPIR